MKIYPYKKSIVFICFLSIVNAYLPLDIIAPALTIIRDEFSVSVNTAQWCISIYLLALTLGPLPSGIYSDQVGRKRVLLFCISLLGLGSLMAALSVNIYMLFIARFIQGCATASCVSLSRTMLRDNFKGPSMAHMLSLLAIAIEFSLVFSPFIGGLLTEYLGWRAIFFFTATLSFVIAFFIKRFLSEPSQSVNKKTIQLKTVMTNIVKLSKHRGFMSYAICGSLAFSSLIAYFSISPFVLTKRFDISPDEYGFFTMIMIFPFVLGPLINSILIYRLGLLNLLIIGNSVALLSSFALLLSEYFFAAPLHIFILCMAGITFGTSFFFSNCVAGALHYFSEIAGLAGAWFTTLQYLGSFMVSASISILPYDGGMGMALSFFVINLITLTILSSGYKIINIKHST